jgi:uncharacterized YccA/Bax inhibitor family protein
MESRNPVFARSQEFQRGGYATFDTRTPSSGELEEMYGAPPATPVQMGRMTIDDVVMRTATIFAVLLVAAGVTYALKPPFIVVIGAALVGFVLSLVITFRKVISPPLILVYGALEGVFVGGISYYYEERFDGIVAQAVLGTLGAFASMLALYKVGAIRATPRFQRTLIIAGVGYLAFAMMHFLGVAFGFWDSIYRGGGILAIALSAFGVVLASLFLVLDFDQIEQGIRNGAPEKFAWLAGFGLVVTLVWLYLEILRLISILRGD